MKYVYFLIVLVAFAACTPNVKNREAASQTSAATDNQDSVKTESDEATIVKEEAQPVQKPVVEVRPEKNDPSKKILKCKFQSLEVGDCLHMIFDCADFGTATTASLSADQLKLWSELTVFEGHGDYPGANPKYIGKTFEIIHNYAEGNTCEPGPNGEAVKGQVPNILSFKLIAN